MSTTSGSGGGSFRPGRGQEGGVNIVGTGVTVNAAGDIVGRDKMVNIYEISRAQVDELFRPVMHAIDAAKPEQRAEAVEHVEMLKQQVAKGKSADDTVMARMVEKLADLVPGAVSAIAGTFGTPLLAGVAGPVTHWVLDKAMGK